MASKKEVDAKLREVIKNDKELIVRVKNRFGSVKAVTMLKAKSMLKSSELYGDDQTIYHTNPLVKEVKEVKEVKAPVKEVAKKKVEWKTK